MATTADLVAFHECVFEGVKGDSSMPYAMDMGDGQHVAVIKDKAIPRIFEVWEQNANGVQSVVCGVYNLADLKSGHVKFYRALPSYSTVKKSLRLAHI